ncbi:serine/threonine-protein kinase [uncultured Tolumonas sp.]|uniref:serine/threonine-protein kinase n=1 Tax=uncultured Tolumonas sp. TaxID=263765 RepID=UPI002A0A639C|nr:serine/threonine-protein kinase [uncultured Tolumonas sp.]
MTYSDVKKLGEGGFAIVMQVQEDSTGVNFAKKIYSPQKHLVTVVGDEHLKKRFKREVRYQKSLNHPNIVQIVEENLDDEPPSFIMPLAIGTMSDDIKTRQQTGWDPKKSLFDILAGLEALHAAGFVHRDLKPANVLKFNNNGSIDYAISDFGLITGDHGDSTTLTGSNDGGGTPNYAAPELLRGFKTATHLADIYSFGAILHDIYSNNTIRIPYTELNIPGELGPIITKCTKSLPIRRYSNISALREDLYNVLNTTTITFNSSDEKMVVDLLNLKNELTESEWDSVYTILDYNIDKKNNIHNIFSSLRESHIKQLSIESPELLVAVGVMFADFINNNAFNFDYCDILASKAGLFYELGDIQLKAKIALATLELGTSHNRWYVERKFVSMVGVDIPEQLAKRIAIEIDVQEFEFKRKFSHLSSSIGVEIEILHPILQKKLNDI